MKKENKKIFAFTVILVILISSVSIVVYSKYFKNELDQNISINYEIISNIERHVKINVWPPIRFSYEIMKPNVLQHLDRSYTYDVIPPELYNGYLFQGIHRLKKGTSIEIEVFLPSIIYFFFHDTINGGYSDMFPNLDCWERMPVAPQYDIYNGNHGLKMIMYRCKCLKGKYIIPPTTKEDACFNIVVQPI